MKWLKRILEVKEVHSQEAVSSEKNFQKTRKIEIK